MQPRLAIAGVVCLASTLFGACAFGVRQKAAGGLGARVSTASLVAAVQFDEAERLRRAAAFRDGGRYYK
jgi:hypothetical protein